MDNLEFEKLIKEAVIKETVVPKEVELKMKKAYSKLSKKKKKKRNFKRIISVAAMLMIVAFIGVNVMAYSQGKDNIFTFLLEKFNIGQEYEENAQNIGITVESNGTKITITDAAMTDELLILGYQIQTNQSLTNKIFLNGDRRILKGKNQEIAINYLSLSERENKQIVEKVSEKEYRIYEIYEIGNIKDLSDEVKVKIELSDIQTYQVDPYQYQVENRISGKWNFEINLGKNQSLKQEEYQIENTKIKLSNLDANLEIINLKITDLASVLSVYLQPYGQMPANTFYTIEIKDKDGNTILSKDSQKIDAFTNTLVMKKIDKEKDLDVYVYQRDQDTILGKGTISLKTNGKKVEQPIKREYESIQYQALALQIPIDWEENINDDNDLSYILYYDLNSQRKEIDSTFVIHKIGEVENLEKAKEETQVDLLSSNIIEEQNPIYDESGKGETIAILSKQEVYDLLLEKKDKIEKENQTITKKDLENNLMEQGAKITKIEKTKIAGKEAYKLEKQSYSEGEASYVFVVDKIAYQIRYNLSSRYIFEIENVIKNIKVK